jgi:hypothetical protein
MTFAFSFRKRKSWQHEPSMHRPRNASQTRRMQSPSTGISIGAFENGSQIQAIFIHHPQRELHEVRYARCVGIPSGLSPIPPGVGIITSRTGEGRYGCKTSSSRRLTNHASTPVKSMSAKVTSSTPGTSAFVRANAFACRRVSSRQILS